ncbi:hypothetical protein EVAR_96403_1 [Eumeta japonica]|uniref:Uncharacterized protein n=1 Tax=Eumeta variegata TaxID=151549 RepID=A0A4C1WE14_EUMVA|nr:hypothetical protein EVAR_96403_1 [Eumeta japonica]
MKLLICIAHARIGISQPCRLATGQCLAWSVPVLVSSDLANCVTETETDEGSNSLGAPSSSRRPPTLVWAVWPAVAVAFPVRILSVQNPDDIDISVEKQRSKAFEKKSASSVLCTNTRGRSERRPQSLMLTTMNRGGRWRVASDVSLQVHPVFGVYFAGVQIMIPESVPFSSQV